MTTVEKLLIRGIRSFPPDGSSIIEFYKPLTIIVGQNGAGKTTIIECLKYATTGDMPPNCRSGQAFIHDTRIAGEREVKAQVKLKFTKANGKPVVVTRSLLLTQKAQRQEYKTLDSIVQTYTDKNEKVTTPCRCADLDKLLPEVMGVTTAILESVVFCHQEESEWPLSEGAKLKAKFDEIFAATKYTKALESVKKLKKDQLGAIKEMKLRLETLKAHKTRSEQLWETLDTLQHRLSSQKELLSQVESGIKTLEGQAAERRNILSQKSKEAEERVRAKERLDAAKESVESLRKEIGTELTDMSDEDLANELKRVAETAPQSEQCIAEFNKAQQQLDESERFLDALRRNADKEEGKLATLKNHRKSLYEKRDRLLVDSDNSLQIPKGDVFPDDVVDAVMTKLENRIQTITNELDSESTKHENAVEHLSKEKQHYTELSSQIDGRIVAMQREKREREEIILKGEIAKRERAETEMRKKEIDELIKMKITQRDAIPQLHDFSVAIQRLISSRQTAEEKRQIITDELYEAKGEFEKATILQKRAAEIEQEEKEITKEYENQKTTFCNLKVSNVDISRFSFSQLISFIKPIKDASSEKLNHFIQQLNDIETNIKELNGKEETLKTKITEIKKQIKELSAESFTITDEDIKQTEDKIAMEKKLIALYRAAGNIYESYIKDAETECGCPLCKRKFDTDDALHSFIEELKEIQESSKSIESHERELGICETKLKEMLLQRETANKVEMLQLTLSQSETEMTKISDKATELENSRTTAIQNKEREQHVFETLKEIAYSVEKLSQEQSKCDEKTEQLSKEKGGVRQNIESIVEQKGEELNKLRDEISELTAEQQKTERESAEQQSKLRALDSEISTLREELENVKRAEGENALAIAREEQERTKIAELESEISACTEKRKACDTKLSTFSEQLLLEEQRWKAYYEDKKQQQEHFQSTLATIKSAVIDAQNLSLSDAEMALSIAQAKVKQQQEKTTALQSKVETLSSAVKAATEKVAEKSLRMRNINDNIQYRKQLAKVSQIENEIKELDKAFNVSFSLDDLQTELEKIEEELSTVKSKRDRLSGANATIDEQIHTTTAELKKPVYANIDKEYNDAVIAMKTTELAHEDLDKYYRALERALLQYHSSKMDCINRTIAELWQSTYRGNDIDAIEIRTDVSDSTKGKSYNYRVVMLKNGVDIDMRGRCSAGQKVLASLVIRMALAETFCVNCGILALDEPTTNLDRDNVESLAAALVSLIDSRSAQRNFQLIVITHDEDFVSLLGKSQHADYFWRVEKDAKGQSFIQRQDIAALE